MITLDISNRHDDFENGKNVLLDSTDVDTQKSIDTAQNDVVDSAGLEVKAGHVKKVTDPPPTGNAAIHYP